MEISQWLNLWNKVKYGWDLNRIHNDLEFVIDVSHWTTNKEQFSRDKFAEFAEKRRLKALMFKLSDSWNGRPFYDDCAEFWYQIAIDFDLLTNGYHWLQPGLDPTVAWNFHNDWLKDHPMTLPNIVDFEEPKVTNATDYLWRLKTFIEYAGRETIIYTGMSYLYKMKAGINQAYWAQKMGWMDAYPLWLAYYSRYYPPVDKLFPFTDGFVGWQYSPNADYPYYGDGDNLDGTYWGVTSKGGDVNWFDKSFLDKYRIEVEEPEEPIEEPIETPEPIEPEEEPEIPPNTNDLTYKTKSKMNVRSGAGTNYPVVDSLEQGKEVSVNDIGGSGCWIEFEPGKWVCKSLNGYEYLVKKEG